MMKAPVTIAKMTSTEFNNKYEAWLERGHYGLDIDEPAVVEYLDGLFEELTKREGFSYAQIKFKLDGTRAYTSLSFEDNKEIEQEILRIVRNETGRSFGI